jgi:hypothetical protein
MMKSAQCAATFPSARRKNPKLNFDQGFARRVFMSLPPFNPVHPGVVMV